MTECVFVSGIKVFTLCRHSFILSFLLSFLCKMLGIDASFGDEVKVWIKKPPASLIFLVANKFIKHPFFCTLHINTKPFMFLKEQ